MEYATLNNGVTNAYGRHRHLFADAGSKRRLLCSPPSSVAIA